MIYTTRGTPVVAKWPRKRGKKLHPNTVAQNARFRMWSWAIKYLPAEVHAAAIQAVKGTPFMPRDLLMLILSNRAYWLTTTDGRKLFPMPAVQDVSESIDAVAQVPGSLLFRGAELWQGLAAGAAGQVLVANGPLVEPGWGTPSGAPGVGVQLSQAFAAASGSPAAAKGINFVPNQAMRVMAVTCSVAQVSGKVYRAQLLQVSATGQITALISTSGNWSQAITGSVWQTFQFPTLPVLSPGTRYAVVHVRTSDLGTTSSGIDGGTFVGGPWPVQRDNGFVSYASNNPAVGQVPLGFGTNRDGYCMTIHAML